MKGTLRVEWPDVVSILEKELGIKQIRLMMKCGYEPDRKVYQYPAYIEGEIDIVDAHA